MLYLIENGPAPTTAVVAPVATGTSIKTLLQLVSKHSSLGFTIVEWGVSFDGSAAATPGKVELIETDVGATITQYANADFHKLDAEALRGGDPTTQIFDVSSTTKSGYTASGEGTITAGRLLAPSQLIAPTTQYQQQFPLGQQPWVDGAKFMRIRVHFGTTVNAYAYVIVKV